jgi:hypothetical protein
VLELLFEHFHVTKFSSGTSFRCYKTRVVGAQILLGSGEKNCPMVPLVLAIELRKGKRENVVMVK